MSPVLCRSYDTRTTVRLYIVGVVDKEFGTSGAGTMGHGGHVPPARGARAPHFSRWLGTGGGTVEERLITIIYCNMPTTPCPEEKVPFDFLP